MKKDSMTWIVLAGVLVAAILIVSLFADGQDASAYERGHEALLNQDCQTAVAEFENVLRAPRIIDLRSFAYLSRREKAQCDLYQKGVEQEMAGTFGSAASTYYTLLRDFGDSPLASLAQERVNAIINAYAPEALVGDEFCRDFTGVASGAGTAEQTSGGNYPRIVDACGRMYEGRGDWKNAQHLYSAYLEGHIGDTWSDYFSNAMARAMLNDVSTRSPGQLPAPYYLGPWTGSAIVLNFFNDSPDKVTVTVNGPVTRIFELDGCRDCQTYAAPGPAACPKQGKSASYEMPQGNYNIIVEAGTGTSARPFVGYWALGSGQYDSCFTKIQ